MIGAVCDTARLDIRNIGLMDNPRNPCPSIAYQLPAFGVVGGSSRSEPARRLQAEASYAMRPLSVLLALTLHLAAFALLYDANLEPRFATESPVAVELVFDRVDTSATEPVAPAEASPGPPTEARIPIETPAGPMLNVVRMVMPPPPRVARVAVSMPAPIYPPAAFDPARVRLPPRPVLQRMKADDAGGHDPRVEAGSSPEHRPPPLPSRKPHRVMADTASLSHSDESPTRAAVAPGPRANPVAEGLDGTVVAVEPVRDVAAIETGNGPIVGAAPTPVSGPKNPPVVADELRPLASPAPVYPGRARRLGFEGKVLLRVRIDDAGRVMAAKVAESSGFAELDAAAVKAARSWRFEPPGQITEASIPFEFRLID